MKTIADAKLKQNLVIGLTGSSGSGKSEAAKILAGWGAAIIDADAISRAIVEERSVLDELICAFGEWVVDREGKFNRAIVSKRAFSDAATLARLSEITHKYIAKEIYRQVERLKSSHDGFIVIDAPIPAKNGFIDISDVVWVIKSPASQRLKRILARDGISVEAALARISSQLPDGEYERLADSVIINDGGIDKLKNNLKRYINMVKDLK